MSRKHRLPNETIWGRWSIFSAGFVALLVAGCVGSTDSAATVRSFHRILFLGNSITLHGPSPSIGWTGNWGMAASTESRDYAHVLAARIPGATFDVRNVS